MVIWKRKRFSMLPGTRIVTMAGSVVFVKNRALRHLFDAKIDAFEKNRIGNPFVVPVQAGIQLFQWGRRLPPTRLCRN